MRGRPKPYATALMRNMCGLTECLVIGCVCSFVCVCMYVCACVCLFTAKGSWKFTVICHTESTGETRRLQKFQKYQKKEADQKTAHEQPYFCISIHIAKFKMLKG